MDTYLDKRVISVFFLGLAQGLPWVLIGSMLTLWLKEAGIGRADIGYAGLIFTVYAINFLWSPLIDRFKLKILWLSQRQSWAITCQLLMIVCCIIMAQLDPSHAAKTIVLFALGIAIMSATQDIAIDAYRVDSFSNKETQHISAGAAMITAGWWSGYAGLGYIPLRLSDMGWSWAELYQLMAVIVVAICIITSLLPKPRFTQGETQQENYDNYVGLSTSLSQPKKLKLLALILSPFVIVIWAISGSPGMPTTISHHTSYFPLLILGMVCFCTFIGITLSRLEHDSVGALGATRNPIDHLLAQVMTALVAPLKEFFSRNGAKYAVSLLAFILLFKIGEAFLGRMSIVFYKEVGYSNTDIANYSKLLTWWLTVIFAIAGGWVNSKLGLVKGLFVSGCAMAGTNLMFAVIAKVGPETDLYITAIILDGFAQAWSTVAFVSFISLMCNHAFSATQYALMASLSNLGRTSLASVSGQLVDWLNGNWAVFFILTTLMVIPSLVILYKLKDKISSIEAGTNSASAPSNGS